MLTSMLTLYGVGVQAVCPPPALFHSWGGTKPLFWLHNFHQCYASPRQPRLVSSGPTVNTNATNVIAIIYRAPIFFSLITMNLNRWGSWGVTIKAKQFNNIMPPPSRGVPPPSRGFAHKKPRHNLMRRGVNLTVIYRPGILITVDRIGPLSPIRCAAS